MKQCCLCFICILCLLLGGCSWMDGSYVSVTPHEQPLSDLVGENVSASNYQELCEVLEDMITSGSESAVINVEDYDQNSVEGGMKLAVTRVLTTSPMGAYAVEDISYELGASGGVPAIAVRIEYRHGLGEIRKIQRAVDMEAVKVLIGSALGRYDPGVVILVDHYSPVDATQIVEDYAAYNPSVVMESPQVSVELYPNSGKQRILELKFTYQTSRDNLRQMRSQVKPVFDAAALYVSGDGEENQKYSQLYAFLMERFTDYQLKTSITPSYSLLRHGVGDSKAFACVYAEMCRKAGLTCQVVVGTRGGEPWCWNIVQVDGYFYHVDLLGSRDFGGFHKLTDSQMIDYVWDYSAYPECTGAPPAPEHQETLPSTDPTEPEALPEETVIPETVPASTEK